MRALPTSLVFAVFLVIGGEVGRAAQEPAQTKPASQPQEGEDAQSAPAESRRGPRTRPRRTAGSAPAGVPIAIEHVKVLRAGQKSLEGATVLTRGHKIVAVGD